MLEQRISANEQQCKELLQLFSTRVETEKIDKLIDKVNEHTNLIDGLESKFKRVQLRLNDWVTNFENEIKKIDQHFNKKFEKLK